MRQWSTSSVRILSPISELSSDIKSSSVKKENEADCRVVEPINIPESVDGDNLNLNKFSCKNIITVRNFANTDTGDSCIYS